MLVTSLFLKISKFSKKPTKAEIGTFDNLLKNKSNKFTNLRIFLINVRNASQALLEANFDYVYEIISDTKEAWYLLESGIQNSQHWSPAHGLH